MNIKTSNDRRRRAMVWCSQNKCIHGADYQHPTTGKYFCKHCANLLDKSQLTRLADTVNVPEELA
jgi:hypothetical protein